MTKRLLQVVFVVAGSAFWQCSIQLHGQEVSSTVTIPAYQPQPIMGGPIRSWGHVFLKKVMVSWELGFQKYHPDVTFSDNLVSSAAATGALFTNTADLGIVGREIRRSKSPAIAA